MRGQRLVLTDQTRRGGSQSHRGPGSPETRCHDSRSGAENDSVKINKSKLKVQCFLIYLRRLFREHDDEEVAVFALCAEHRGLGADLAPVTMSRILSCCVSRIMSRTCNAQWRPRSGWRGVVRSRYSALCLYLLRAY